MSRLPCDMWWSFGWDRPSTWVTSYTHRTSPSAYVLILWSRPWVYSAVRTGMKSTPADQMAQYVCYWRCPVPDCSLWFTSELNGKDHIEHTHRFREGHGHSFYECLGKFGLEWFGSRAFFEERKVTGQSLWMDLALARHSGQELRNTYTITRNPDFAPLRRFFKAEVNQLQLFYAGTPDSFVPQAPLRSLLESMRDEIYTSSVSSDNTMTHESPVTELVIEESPVDDLPTPSSDEVPSSSFADVKPVRSLTPANRSLRFLETGAPGSPHTHMVSLRAAVPGMCIASTDLLSLSIRFLWTGWLYSALVPYETGRLLIGINYSRSLIVTYTWLARTWPS